MKLDQIFKKNLIEELLPSEIRLKHDDFANFQRNPLNQIARNFSVTSLTVTIFQKNGDFRSSLSNIFEKIIDSYGSIALVDDHTPLSQSSPGTAIYSEALRSNEQLLKYKPDRTDYSVNAGRILPLSQAYRFYELGSSRTNRGFADA